MRRRDTPDLRPEGEFEGAPTLVIGSRRIAVRRIAWQFTVSRGTTVSVVEHEPSVTLISADGDVLRVSSEHRLSELQLGSWAA
ncbi:MAG: hypothetical protein Q7T55_22360 [Solirubrobacteraceae bacterium]|nr:hypothetical protein [Solirubrobacteraceae bacterium]